MDVQNSKAKLQEYFNEEDYRLQTSHIVIQRMTFSKSQGGFCMQITPYSVEVNNQTLID